MPDRSRGDCLVIARATEDQLESGGDGGNIMEDNKEPIRDVLRKGQQPTECGYCKFIQDNRLLSNSHINIIACCVIV